MKERLAAGWVVNHRQTVRISNRAEARSISMMSKSFGRQPGSHKLVLFGIMVYIMPSVTARIISSISHPTAPATFNPGKKGKYCWESEKFSTIAECIPCSSFDMDQERFCKDTGNKQLVQCESSKTKSYISCPIAILYERKRFWTFEAVSLAGALLSNLVVLWRRRALNTFHYQRVKRQMSSATV